MHEVHHTSTFGLELEGSAMTHGFSIAFACRKVGRHSSPEVRPIMKIFLDDEDARLGKDVAFKRESSAK